MLVLLPRATRTRLVPPDLASIPNELRDGRWLFRWWRNFTQRRRSSELLWRSVLEAHGAFETLLTFRFFRIDFRLRA